MDTRGGGDLRGLLSSRDWYALGEGDSDVVVSCILFKVARLGCWNQRGTLAWNQRGTLAQENLCTKLLPENETTKKNYTATLEKFIESKNKAIYFQKEWSKKNSWTSSYTLDSATHVASLGLFLFQLVLKHSSGMFIDNDESLVAWWPLIIPCLIHF